MQMQLWNLQGQNPYGRVPSLLGLFDKFWSQKLQRSIVQETNRYALKIINDNEGKMRGREGAWSGLHWACQSFGLIFPCVYLWGSRNCPLSACIGAPQCSGKGESLQGRNVV
jgi:hypothetical protein